MIRTGQRVRRTVLVLRGAARGYAANGAGQGLVEFALLLPVLLALLIGAIELGQAWRSSQAVTHAAREGARLSVIPTSTNIAVTQRISSTLQAGSLDPARAHVELRRRTGTGTLDTVTVRYPYEFRLLRPVLRLTGANSGAVPGAVWLSSTFVMRNE